MKKVLLIALLALTASCKTVPMVGIVEKREVIEIPGIDKYELFVRANEWMVDAFVSAESVIEFADKEAGVVKGNYTVIPAFGGVHVGYGIYSGATAGLKSTITVRVKDGSALLVITPNRSSISQPEALTMRQKTAPLVESFKNAMVNKRADW